MRDTTIARNYAEVLLALARKANDLPGWGAMTGCAGFSRHRRLRPSTSRR